MLVHAIQADPHRVQQDFRQLGILTPLGQTLDEGALLVHPRLGLRDVPQVMCWPARECTLSVRGFVLMTSRSVSASFKEEREDVVSPCTAIRPRAGSATWPAVRRLGIRCSPFQRGPR